MGRCSSLYSGHGHRESGKQAAADPVRELGEATVTLAGDERTGGEGHSSDTPLRSSRRTQPSPSVTTRPAGRLRRRGVRLSVQTTGQPPSPLVAGDIAPGAAAIFATCSRRHLFCLPDCTGYSTALRASHCAGIPGATQGGQMSGAGTKRSGWRSPHSNPQGKSPSCADSPHARSTERSDAATFERLASVVASVAIRRTWTTG
jgi:hypothetical protein